MKSVRDELMRITAEALSRPLGSFERIFWRAGAADAGCIALAADIEGRTTPQDWRLALGAVQDRHPLLATRIGAFGDGAPRLVPSPGSPIPLRVVDASAMDSWALEMASEMAVPFDTSKAPLARAVLLHGADRAVLILVAHHAIFDGPSLSFAIRDALRAMAGEPLGEPSAPSSLDDLAGLPADLAAPPSAPARASRPARMEPPRPTVVPHVEHLRLSAGLTASLARCSAQELASVQGAISAALVLAAGTLSTEWGKWGEGDIQVLSPIDLRGALDVGEDCGLCMTSAVTAHQAGPSGAFWSRARQATRELPERVTRESAVARVKAMRGWVHAKSGADLAPEATRDHRSLDIVLTKLDELACGTAIGRLKIGSWWGPLALTGSANEHAVGLATANGRLSLMLASRKPLRGLLGAVATLLEDACLSSTSSKTDPVLERFLRGVHSGRAATRALFD
jgi:hypothetical protein